MTKGCRGYVATVMDTWQEKSRLEDISIVNEFLDVSHEDLPELSSDKEIEFAINLIPRSNLISKAPYWMVLVKLKELKA